jgi:hypothetical protein
MTEFIGDDYIKSLPKVGLDEWSRGEALELAAALNVPVVSKALALVVKEASDAVFQFRGLDLTAQKGVAEGIKIQGRADGMLGVVQLLCDLAEEGNKDE